MKRSLDPTHDWALEIGRLVIAFGSIEHVTVLCLQHLPLAKPTERSGRPQLGARIDRLCTFLASSAHAEDGELLAKLLQARSLVDRRNLILHNPLVLDVYMTENNLRFTRPSIRSLRNSQKHVSFSDLRLARNEAESLASSLYALASKVMAIDRTPSPE